MKTLLYFVQYSIFGYYLAILSGAAYGFYREYDEQHILYHFWMCLSILAIVLGFNVLNFTSNIIHNLEFKFVSYEPAKIDGVEENS